MGRSQYFRYSIEARRCVANWIYNGRTSVSGLESEATMVNYIKVRDCVDVIVLNRIETVPITSISSRDAVRPQCEYCIIFLWSTRGVATLWWWVTKIVCDAFDGDCSFNNWEISFYWPHIGNSMCCTLFSCGYIVITSSLCNNKWAIVPHSRKRFGSHCVKRVRNIFTQKNALTSHAVCYCWPYFRGAKSMWEGAPTIIVSMSICDTWLRRVEVHSVWIYLWNWIAGRK